MPYYPTLDEDLARAKEILARGSVSAEPLAGITGPVIISLAGGTVTGADIYAAYKLIESFVEAIDELRGELAACNRDKRTLQATNERLQASR